MKIQISETQYKKLVSRVKKEKKPWYMSGKDWEWTDEDDKALEKMKQDFEDKKNIKKQEDMKLNEEISRIKKMMALNETTIVAPQSGTLTNLPNNPLQVVNDGTIVVTNSKKQGVRIKFTVTKAFVSFPIGIGKIDENGQSIIITTKETKRRATLTKNHLNTLMSLVDSNQKSIPLENVAVEEADGSDKTTITINATKI